MIWRSLKIWFVTMFQILPLVLATNSVGLTDEYLVLKAELYDKYCLDSGNLDSSSLPGCALAQRMAYILQAHKEHTKQYYRELRDIGLYLANCVIMANRTDMRPSDLQGLDIMQQIADEFIKDSEIGMYVLQGYTSEEATILREAIYSSPQNAIPLYEELLKRRPDMSNNRLILANLYYQVKNYKKFEEQFQTIHRYIAEYAPQIHFSGLHRLYLEALQHYSRKNPQLHEKLITDIFGVKLKKLIEIDMENRMLTDYKDTFYLYLYCYSWMHKQGQFDAEQNSIAKRLFSDAEDLGEVAVGISNNATEEEHLNLITRAIQSRERTQRKAFVKRLRKLYLVEDHENRFFQREEIKKKLGTLFLTE